MVGIDYGQANIQLREQFAMTESAAAQAEKQICIEWGADGCVILSTCNRTEVWIHGHTKVPLEKIFCRLKGLKDSFAGFLQVRTGKEAVAHLFALCCGIKSQVFGEDQILTQVGRALEVSRTAGMTDPVLEQLFRMAVTAAKRVKTEIRLTDADQSVAVRLTDFLRKQVGILSGKCCLVIGNGEMGRLAASALVQEGCQVLMTIRQYRHGDVLLPGGVCAIPYDSRMTALEKADIVVSATASPHYTLHADRIPHLTHPTLFCDLAVPRDIDPQIQFLDQAALYDTDQICGNNPRRDEQELEKAEQLLEDAAKEFEIWYEFRPLIPMVKEISQLAAQDLVARVERTVRQSGLPRESQGQLLERITDASQKVVGRMLFGLRENLSPELWDSCISGLEQAVREEAG